MKDLRRRINQQQHRSSHDVIRVQGHNSADLTWKNAYDAVDDLEYAGVARNDFPLNFGQLRGAGEQLHNILYFWHKIKTY